MSNQNPKPPAISKLPEYRIWAGIKTRCTNPKVAHWKYYGGLGVKVCFDSFQQLLMDIGPRPDPYPTDGRYTIDRWPNPHGNYEPGNVRWATMKQQAQNERNSVLVQLKRYKP